MSARSVMFSQWAFAKTPSCTMNIALHQCDTDVIHTVKWASILRMS